MQQPISHSSESKLLNTRWIEIYSVYQVTSIRFPHADDTQIVYHSRRLFRPCLKTFVAPFLPARHGLRGWTRRGLKNVCVGRFEVTSLSSRRLELVGEIENRSARGRHVSPSCAFFLAPTTSKRLLRRLRSD